MEQDPKANGKADTPGAQADPDIEFEIKIVKSRTQGVVVHNFPLDPVIALGMFETGKVVLIQYFEAQVKQARLQEASRIVRPGALMPITKVPRRPS